MTSGPPPSSFNYPVASSSSSSPSFSAPLKRHSVPSSLSGPRPLHLVDIAISSPTVLSPTRLSLSNSPIQPPSPIGLSQSLSSFSAPHSRSSTPRSAKRQSTISYFSPNHESTREKEGSGKRTSSPSCLPATAGASGARPGDGGIRASVEALVPSKVVNVQRDRPPVTSAEKHAELLNFIAQKEAKCLELRSQLAMHEEELLQLKRKWERIINRGLERENNPSLSYSSTNPPTNTKDIPTALMSLTTNPSLTLEGIKEGVQGMSRILAAGLSITAPPPAPSDAFQSNHARPPKLGVPPPISRHSQSSSPVLPSPLSASSTLVSSGRTYARHTPRESDASSGTATTTTSTDTFANRLSQGSSSTTSLEEEESGKGGGERRGEVYGSPQELIINDTGATPTVSPNPAFLEQRERRRQRLLLLQEEGEGEGRTNKKPVEESVYVEDEMAWDPWGDVGDNHGMREDVSTLRLMDPPVKTRRAPHTSLGSTPLASSIPTFGAASQSIAGLTALASPQVSSWMGSMGKKIGGELQKSTSALSRSQKRASVMLSDMSQSFVSALTPTADGPSTSTPARSPSPLPPIAGQDGGSRNGTGKTPSPVAGASTSRALSLSSPLARDLNGNNSKPSSATIKPSNSISLLDEDEDEDEDDGDEDGFGPLVGTPQTGNGGAGMTVMKPDVKSTSPTVVAETAQDDDDDWNW